MHFETYWILSYPSPSRWINVSLHKGKTIPTEHELRRLRKTSVLQLNPAYQTDGNIMHLSVSASPIHRTEIHSQHHALLRVLPAVGWDHHHVASDLSVYALQTNRLEQERHKRRLCSLSTTRRLNCQCARWWAPTSLMLSSGLRRVNMVCRCSWMSPGRMREIKNTSLIRVQIRSSECWNASSFFLNQPHY